MNRKITSGGATVLNILLNAGMFISSLTYPDYKDQRLTGRTSLEKDASRRATPWRMLDHPWMIELSSKRVNMEHFLKTVWDWE